MEKSTTPIPSPDRELEEELRDSHVRLKDVPTTEAEWQAIDEETKASEVNTTPLLNSAGPRLALVSITPKEPVTPVEPERGAEIIPLRFPGKGIVDAERAIIADESEARFHKRKAIEHAVHRAKTSRSSADLPAIPSIFTGHRRSSRSTFWLIGVVVTLVLLGAGILIASSLLAPSAPAPSTSLGGPPVSSIELELHGVPSGAMISVDGVTQRRTTVELPVDGQHHTLTVEAEGYQPWTLTLSPSNDREIPVSLVREPTGERP